MAKADDSGLFDGLVWPSKTDLRKHKEHMDRQFADLRDRLDIISHKLDVIDARVAVLGGDPDMVARLQAATAALNAALATQPPTSVKGRM